MNLQNYLLFKNLARMKEFFKDSVSFISYKFHMKKLLYIYKREE